MSPSGTMMRVYAELRRRIMEGELKPGIRLDPAKLTKEMSASMTPLRDALHQLKGEGLVESWKHEGFWIADLSEPVIRDRYEWCRDLVRLCLRNATGLPPPGITDAGGSYADIVTHLFRSIAMQSTSQEHWRAIESVCDRCYLLRKTEARLLSDPFSDIEPLLLRIERRAWSECLSAYDAFHHRRMEIISQLAAAVRPR
jgi:DNA-binding transcriptional regulator YhcF (GntR family)